ncbi:RES family NAD+ phosphorylase [Thiohalobacter thiocyanaticus]|uniref:RES domain-containing protein n=1 Tax=Thiohalobacter thiocyanaticus TaxID=585455 RepID=A0A426QJK4_9GAMM|nr:RES family NAD+ phosphorylase [Thiohalobacter thiocyanaticus]RRQ21944.1 RES domain-containing protein [Thiohalobacter thiocyanaticus]
MEPARLPHARITWTPSVRVVASRFPPVGLFDSVADPADLETVFDIEGLTNPRLRQEAGDISLVPPEDRISGPGATPIMAAFTHLNPDGSRFSDGTYGVYYASRTMETAIRETLHHRERFLRYTNEPPIELDQRVYYSDIDAELTDIRPYRDMRPEWYDPDSYKASQRLANALRNSKGNGLVYHSVRHEGGECIAVFRPRLLSPARQGPHLTYVWDGEAITHVYEKRKLRV